jgi:uncharacterized damage-inducible protein DinB
VTTSLELSKQRAKRTHDLILKVVDGLSDDQLARQPAPQTHPMAWTLWHIARIADQLAVEVSGTRREIWLQDELARKWGFDARMLGSNGAGTGIDDETAARVRPPTKDQLIDYCRRAFAAAEEAVGRLEESDLDRELDSAWLERHTTIGDSLFTALTHDNRHLGELEYAKGLLGLRGSVTR